MNEDIQEKKRWISTTSAQCMVVAAFIFLAVFVLGSEVDIPEDEARMLIGEFEGQFVGIQWYDIFVHNLTIALGMFIPFGGFVKLFGEESNKSKDSLSQATKLARFIIIFSASPLARAVLT